MPFQTRSVDFKKKIQGNCRNHIKMLGCDKGKWHFVLSCVIVSIGLLRTAKYTMIKFCLWFMRKYIWDNLLIGKLIPLYSKSYSRFQFLITMIVACSKNRNSNVIWKFLSSKYSVFNFHIMQCFERCELLTNGFMS